MIVDLCLARGVEVEVVGVDVSEVSELGMRGKALFGSVELGMEGSAWLCFEP